ncbi:23147234-4904-4ae1-896b-19f665238165 [Thermothielavioides terrestris]|uniref:23147234-4904-4ae1-896b-19f665238165 n=1 Tax=Thermothielavioides terrestris TaxID=2587410 RepID=A0A3S5CXE0_9PEZI|nr:23147234-4904-4ae1-896b-19f665238165 [Thermothielavioides terrestris]
MARVASAALLTAVFAPAIGNRLFVLAGCTTNSFTTPSWLVENYASQTLGNSTVAAFQALNRATNTSLQLRCQASSNATAPGGWQSCSAQNRTNSDLPFVAAFQASNYTAYFFFNETWACSDVPGKPMNFTAIGNSSVPISCSTDPSSGTTCKSTKPLLVKAELLSPVKITPAYVSGPTGHDTKGCTADSRTPAWEVEATQLNLQNGTGKIQGGNAFVIVTNDHLGYTASCGGSSRLLLGLSRWRARAKPSTSAQPDTNFAITATGTTNLTLDCQTFEGGTTFCTGGTSGAFPGNVTSHTLLQPYSLDDPLPTTDSCTVASMLSPAWWLDNFASNTTTNHSDVETVSFAMELQTSGQPTGNAAYIATDGVRSSNGSAPANSSAAALPWYPCNITSVGDPTLAPTNCSFRYDMPSRFLGLQVQWQCADLDAHSP